jgi:hypothetical protein
MESSDTERRLDDVLRADAQEVARRTLRYKFGRLSNRRILATLKAALPAEPQSPLADGELLDRWFAEYAAAVDRLRREARPTSQAS